MLKWFNKNKEKKNKGFTLVELIVVIAILAILVGLLAPQYTKYVEKSRKSADVSNLENIVTGFKVAASDHEYNLGGTTDVNNDTTYLIVIYPTNGTSITATNANTDSTNNYIKAIDEYAGINFGTSPNSNLKLKSQKWGKAEIDGVTMPTNLADSSIAALVTINNKTDAVTVAYSKNVDNYSKNGKK